jgi:hypothetical protein
VQACRGESAFLASNKNIGQMSDATQVIEEYKKNNFVLNNVDQTRKLTSLSKEFNSDYLIFYSTTRGFVSMRDTINGTPFVQAICKVFKKSIKNAPLMTMISDITNLIKNNEPVTELIGSMSRTLYFTKVIYT